MSVFVAIWCDEILGVFSTEDVAYKRVLVAAGGKPFSASIGRVEEHVVDAAYQADSQFIETESQRFDREGWPT